MAPMKAMKHRIPLMHVLDKIRYEATSDPDKIENQPNLFIKIFPDKTNSTELPAC
jgi:hypothetical protein